VEVKIGVQNASRELVIDVDQSSEDVETTVAQAIAGDQNVLVLTDTRGRRVIVPADKLAYVEVGSPVAGHVGFHAL
jgi:hypothetical protein